MECFCGCGRRAGVRRGFNQNGSRTDKLLRELESARATVESGSLRAPDSGSDPLVGALRALIAEGEGHWTFWRNAVHGGDWPQGPGQALRAKRDWNQWTENARQITTLVESGEYDQQRVE